MTRESTGAKRRESHPVRFERPGPLRGPEAGFRPQLPEKSGVWLSPVERCVRVAEVPGSNPGTPIVLHGSAVSKV